MRTQYLTELPPHWRPVAEIFAALGDETRQKILLLFEPGDELSIKDIAAQFPLSRTTIVHHLGVLEKAGVLSVRREGRLALYTLRHAPVLDALAKLRLLIADDLAAPAARRAETDSKSAPSTDGTQPTAPEQAAPEDAKAAAPATPYERDLFFLSTYLR